LRIHNTVGTLAAFISSLAMRCCMRIRISARKRHLEISSKVYKLWRIAFRRSYWSHHKRFRVLKCSRKKISMSAISSTVSLMMRNPKKSKIHSKIFMKRLKILSSNVKTETNTKSTKKKWKNKQNIRINLHNRPLHKLLLET